MLKKRKSPPNCVVQKLDNAENDSLFDNKTIIQQFQKLNSAPQRNLENTLDMSSKRTNSLTIQLKNTQPQKGIKFIDISYKDACHSYNNWFAAFTFLNPTEPVIVGNDTQLTLNPLPNTIFKHKNAKKGEKDAKKANQKEVITSEISLFINLPVFLKTIFKNEKSSNMTIFNEHEFAIIKTIFMHKFKYEMKEMSEKNSQHALETFFQKNLNQTSTKTKEENYIYVFQCCIDHLKKQFKKEFKTAKTKQNEKQFYQHHFSKISQEKKINIECFYNPKSSIHKNSKSSENSFVAFATNISLNGLFINQFKKYLNNELIKDSVKLIDKKIEQIIKKWDDLVQKNIETQNANELVQQICAEIKKNKNLTLPWSKSEVEKAIKEVNLLFDMSLFGVDK